MSSKLWYNKPTDKWQQGLPIGNGRIGAVVISSPQRETLRLTELTFWSGDSQGAIGKHGGKKALDEARSHFFKDDFIGGKKVCEEYFMPAKHNFGTNLTVGLMHLEFDHGENYDEFYRELDLGTAIAKTQFGREDNVYERETFCTHVDGILVSRIKSKVPGKLNFTIDLEFEVDEFKVNGSNSSLAFDVHALETNHSDGECGVAGTGIVSVQTKAGKVLCDSGKLSVRDSDEATIYLAMATNYRVKDDVWKHSPKEELSAAIGKGYEQLKRDHIVDYQKLYNRLDLDLGRNGTKSSLPTDERRQKFESGDFDDPELFTLFYQYGRYLTITGNREDSPLPLHLQGLWNDGEANKMNWSCDYHLDINTQMNYFPLEVSNLTECYAPLMRYIQDLSIAGRFTAEKYFGCRGWCAHTFSNVWGYSEPGWDTGWGMNVTGGLWIAVHLIDHYSFSQDDEFLKNEAYPALKSAAEFFLDYMVVDPRNGYLVTGPSVSPENSFLFGADRNKGEHQMSMGPTCDIVLVRDLFNFCLKAANRLDVDPEFQKDLEKSIPLLPPFKIGKQGQLQEWLEDYEEAQPDHRHLSHTLAVFQSNQITPGETPKLSKAVEVTLERRMARENREDIEFTAALFGLDFARLHKADRAFHHLAHLIGGLSFDNLLTYSKPGVAGAETNIFVIDGNFGGAAVLSDMIFQSHAGELHFLPALPDHWPDGSVKGFRAHGNYEVSFEWKNGHLTFAIITSYTRRIANLRIGESAVTLDLVLGKQYKINSKLEIV